MSESRNRRDFIASVAAAAACPSVVTFAESEGQRPGPPSMSITDFERSCLRFRIDTTKKPPKTVSRKLPMTLNNVRMQLDAHTVITNRQSGQVRDYVLTASCKSEQVWVPREIWHQPNADMCMAASSDEFLVIKRWDKADKGVMLYPPSLGVQPERQLDDPRECFDQFTINLATRPGRVLENIDAILEALFSGAPMVAQTEYEMGGHHVLLEYPVKVANFSERERYYQIDTGPILLPDFEREYRSLLEGCRSAYVAHNCGEWAEFIVCVPTPLTDTIRVHHYSHSIRIDNTRNRLIAVS
jgi:hypothetical protein